MQKKGTTRKVGTVSSCGQEGRGNDWGSGAGEGLQEAGTVLLLPSLGFTQRLTA